MSSTSSDIRKTYELACLLSPDLSEEQYKSWLNRLSDAVKKLDGELLGEPQIREQKLAYPIAKRLRAYLAVIKYVSDTSVPDTIMNEIRHEKDILRYLTINIPKERKRPIKVKKAKPETAVSASETQAIPEKQKKDDLAEIDKRIEEILKSSS